MESILIETNEAVKCRRTLIPTQSIEVNSHEADLARALSPLLYSVINNALPLPLSDVHLINRTFGRRMRSSLELFFFCPSFNFFFANSPFSFCLIYFHFFYCIGAMLWFSCVTFILALSSSVLSTFALPTPDDDPSEGRLVKRAKKCAGGGYSPCICPPGKGGPGKEKGIRQKKLKCPDKLAVTYANPEDKHNGDINIGPVLFY